MTESVGSETAVRRVPGGMSEQRRARIRMEISREAAKLFWEHGVVATTAEQIADAVGMSTRSIWRFFRSKEDCAEPIMTFSVEWFLEVMRRWPPALSLEDHLSAERARGRSREDENDDVLARQMIVLTRTEPAIRASWLMACHVVETELVQVIAGRLGRSATDPEMALHAAATTSVVRVITEQLLAVVVTDDPQAVHARAGLDARLARAIRAATGGAVGDPVST